MPPPCDPEVSRLRWSPLVGLLFLGGCAVARQDFIRLNAGTSYEPRPADAPVVLTVGDLDRPYQEVGVIHVSGVSRDGYDQLNDKMRAKAREVGADSIIFVHYGTENVGSIIPFFVAMPYDVLTADGLAVRTVEQSAP
jgi:hypothetical protein